MRPINSCALIAKLAEATGVPYLENLAKVAVIVIELLDVRMTVVCPSVTCCCSSLHLVQKVKTNKHRAKELAESITNTITVINSHVTGRKGEQGSTYFVDVCNEMKRCLSSITEHLKNETRKQCRLKGLLDAHDLRDAIESYRRQIEDLKMDFLIHITSDCLLMQYDLVAEVRTANRAAPRDEIVIHIPIRHARFVMLLFV
ncbi:hypothetical protein EDD18DRAFT_1186347 [Armillaria luteobubalina]|uniref:Uncharacterized protein n=1 Tax=Armillaria luteobubalina TaxID=153913 RepID=A0AA39UPI6_9AGAR|nr:hypothetical protein EDD18DRAFT_1186347 [Armillaria luteobubalina]